MSNEVDDIDADDNDEPAAGIEELKEIAADWRSESAERLRACIAVLREEPDAGRDLLLALSIDPDADEDDRFSALQRLLGMDAPTVAATSWLMWQTSWGISAARSKVKQRASFWAIRPSRPISRPGSH